MKSQTRLTVLALGLLVVLFVALNVLSGHFLASDRLDLTQRKLYTLSDATRELLDQIKEPVDLTLYVSKQLGEAAPQYGLYAQRVRETLDQYAALSKGKVRVRQVDPAPFTDAEDQASAAGLQGIPLDENGSQVYFGLAGTNSTDDVQTIGFLQPDRERFLEYDVTRMVQSLAFPKRKVVGLVATLPVDGDPMAMMRGQEAPPLTVIQQLRQNFEVRNLSAKFDEVPADVDVLMLVHPHDLSPRTMYAIDQFALRGGRVLAFVDPNAEASAGNPMVPHPSIASDLGPLFKSWGIQMVEGKVVGDRQAARRVSLPGQRTTVLEYLAWLAEPETAFNHDDPVTQNLDNMTFATAGILKPLDGAKTKFTPLVQSSPASTEIDVAKTQGIPDVAGILKDFKPSGERYTMVARLAGPIETAFPDGQPAEDKPADQSAPAEPKSNPDKAAAPALRQGTIDAIVVADTDMLQDRLWVQKADFLGQNVDTPIAGNGNFVESAVENLAGGANLGSLRAREIVSRPFTLVDNLKREAENKWRTQEQELRDSLKTTQAKLADLRHSESARDVTAGAVSAEQQKEIDQFEATMIKTRRDLRKVELALRENIDRLKAFLVFVNAGLVPILVAVAAVVLGAWRVRRRRRTVQV
ncbi:MAG: Gldg family protein [Azospirillaceae bacterium]|nr:Gldg family protein [Azospirillaceae bacterium]